MLKIAVVNDSIMAAEILRRVIDSVREYKLTWVAHHGREAIEKCRDNVPDIILMDLIMPEMDGIEATRHISAEFGCAILVVTATVDGHAGRVFEAMGAGALDAVNTPILGPSGQGEGKEILIRKIDAIATLLRGKPLRRKSTPRPLTGHATAQGGVPLIALGASTGGPSALTQVLQAMPPKPAAAIVIVQHVDEQFASSFINWLNEHTPPTVRMAQPGDTPQVGTVLVCGREDHLVLTADGVFDYTNQPPDLVYRPSVDIFFNSLAENYKNPMVAALLTGMGKDGAEGLKALRERGCVTIAQDQATSAVYGMPKAAKELDAAMEILPLGEIGPTLARWAEHTLLGGCKEQQLL